MEMTAEQKYLKALAEWLDIETIPKNRIQEASREYLDQFVDANEKVEPQWKPEVGRLYRDKRNQRIRELTELHRDICNQGIGDPAGFYNNERVKFADEQSEVLGIFLRDYEPIAELEGLKVSDYAYSYINKWFIDNIDNGWITLTGHGLIDADIYGIAVDLSSRQLFWRTADRAERFGKSAG